MTANHWILFSAVIVGSLGAVHLLLTYVGPKLLPRNPAVRVAMESGPMVITGQTSVWRAWIGFNASHSLGAMLFGLVYGYLALVHGELLFGSTFLLVLGLVMLAGYVVLARLYWFITPLLGTAVALGCFVVGVVVGG